MSIHEQGLSEEALLKQECWEKEFKSFGTYKIFEKRAKDLKTKISFITFTGFALPISVGVFVSAFSTNADVFEYFLYVVGVLSIIQALLSLWSVTSHWNDRYSYSVASIKANNRLVSDFKDLSKQSTSKIKKDIDRLRFEYNRQDQEDSAQGITDKERRRAMCCTLMQYQKKCAGCGETPLAVKPTECGICGNF